MDLSNWFTTYQFIAIVLACVIIVSMYKSLKEDEDKDKSSTWKWLPFLSFIISLSAICFQITVLYPWHLELSQEFAALSKRLG